MSRVAVALACAIVAIIPARVLAGAPKCRANDPAAAADQAAVRAIRQAIDASCPCASFPANGKKSRHGDYVKCAKGVVKAAVEAEQLRGQCKKLALYGAALSTCGVPAAPPQNPCLKTSKKGPVCKISKCQGPKDLACPGYDDCLTAADTDRDEQVSATDAGQCRQQDCAAQVNPTQTDIDNLVIECFDGCNDPNDFQECIIGCATGAGAIDEAVQALLTVCEAAPALSCARLHAAYLAQCTVVPSPPTMCADQCINDPACMSNCVAVAGCTRQADRAYATCVAQE